MARSAPPHRICKRVEVSISFNSCSATPSILSPLIFWNLKRFTISASAGPFILRLSKIDSTTILATCNSCKSKLHYARSFMLECVTVWKLESTFTSAYFTELACGAGTSLSQKSLSRLLPSGPLKAFELSLNIL